MVAPGGVCVVVPGGACVVAPGGVHGCSGGHAWDTTTHRDMVNERAVRILLECILLAKCVFSKSGYMNRLWKKRSTRCLMLFQITVVVDNNYCQDMNAVTETDSTVFLALFCGAVCFH